MSDFVMQIGADLDLSKVQEQLDSIKKQKVTLDVEIKGNDDAHNLAKSIEKGIAGTFLSAGSGAYADRDAGRKAKRALRHAFGF